MFRILSVKNIMNFIPYMPRGLELVDNFNYNCLTIKHLLYQTHFDAHFCDFLRVKYGSYGLHVYCVHLQQVSSEDGADINVETRLL